MGNPFNPGGPMIPGQGMATPLASPLVAPPTTPMAGAPVPTQIQNPAAAQPMPQQNLSTSGEGPPRPFPVGGLGGQLAQPGMDPRMAQIFGQMAQARGMQQPAGPGPQGAALPFGNLGGQGNSGLAQAVMAARGGGPGQMNGAGAPAAPAAPAAPQYQMPQWQTAGAVAAPTGG